jgi:hypothetical protein
VVRRFLSSLLIPSNSCFRPCANHDAALLELRRVGVRNLPNHVIGVEIIWEMESPGSNVRDHVWPSAGQTFSEVESTYDAFKFAI